MIKRLDNNNEILDRFIARKHYTRLVNYMNENNMIVAFRSAGKYSIDKLSLGAAAKPHTILDKTIKPKELGLETPTIFANNNVVIDSVDKAKSILCGLVGKRDKSERLVGVYLSSIGMDAFRDPSIGMLIHEVNNTGQGYVSFENLDTLLVRIMCLYARFGDDIFTFFITGDYDMHEVLQVKPDGKIEHIPAETESERSMLYGMSRAAIGENINAAQVDIFEPLEFSPIQHGAQDNYIDHNFIEEQDVRLVEKVVLPAHDIAFYNGIDNSWTIINNEHDDESVYIDASVNQCKEIREYLRVWGADTIEHWRIDTDDATLANLLYSCGRNYFEDVVGRYEQ